MPYIGVSPQFGVRRKHTYTATARQTSFSGAGSEGATLSYTDSNFVDVYQNGVKLGDADYTSTSGTAIVLAQGASVDDIVEIIVFDAFSAADTVSKADGGSFDGAITANAGVKVDNITIDGTEIDLSSGDLTLDVAGDIILDADGGDVNFQDGGTLYGFMAKSNDNLLIGNAISDGDVLIRGNDGGSNISAVTFDMSDAGKATFNSGIVVDNKVQGASGESLTIESQSGGAVIFNSNGANERMRITSAGNVGIGMSPNGKLEVKETAVATIANFYNTHSSTPYGIYIDFSSGSPDDNSSYAFRFEDSTTDRCIIYSDGDIYNHDGTFAQMSDERIKDNITDAKSQWDDIKAMRFVNYQRKDDILQYGKEDAKVQLGLIGQEVEKVSPNLVRQVEPNASDIRHSSEFGTLYEDGDDIPNDKAIGDVKEVKDKVKGVAYSILYMKAVKALQEAMTRIETLETENATQATQIADLISRVTALESK